MSWPIVDVAGEAFDDCDDVDQALAELAKADQLGSDTMTEVDQQQLVASAQHVPAVGKVLHRDHQESGRHGRHDDNLERQRVGDTEPVAHAQVEDEAAPLIDTGFAAVAEPSEGGARVGSEGLPMPLTRSPRQPQRCPSRGGTSAVFRRAAVRGESGCQPGSGAAVRRRATTVVSPRSSRSCASSAVPGSRADMTTLERGSTGRQTGKPL